MAPNGSVSSRLLSGGDERSTTNLSYRKEAMNLLTRRSFVTTAAAGVTAFGALAANPQEGQAQLVYNTSDWKVAAFNKIVQDPARIKQVYDVVAINDGRFLNNIKNSLNGLQYGFGIRAAQIKVVAALHGPANMLNYDDFIWNQYQIGAWLKVEDPATGKPTVKNPYLASRTALHYTSQDPNNEGSLYEDKSIQALQSRGVTFLSCHTATEEQVRVLVQHNNLTADPESIVREMLAHLIPDALSVASMVAAIALLQADGHYTYITV
jgi:hypothetical protein